ncbi:hypothetical protein PENTCL1PPCAC_18610, partial [Pristionchus entomophagus]
NMRHLPLILAISIAIFQLTKAMPTSETYQISKNTVNNAADDMVKAGQDAKTVQDVMDKAEETARNAVKEATYKPEDGTEADDCSFNGFLVSNC